jgi:hypothetical protein
VIDIPYPTHVFPLKNIPVPTPKFKRPPSRLSSSVWTASDSEIYDEEDESDNEPEEYIRRIEKYSPPAERGFLKQESGKALGKGETKKLLSKRGKSGLVKRKIEKRGLTEFLKHNFAAIVGGAVITAGGLWLWERYQKNRAEKAAKKEREIAQNAGNAGNQNGKQGLHVVLKDGDEGEEIEEIGDEGILVTEEGTGSQPEKPYVDPGETCEEQSAETVNNVCTDCEHC